jgi:serine O-acetyltransferase
MDWREFWPRLRQDARRLRRLQSSKFGYVPATWFLDPAFVCVFLYRLSHLMTTRGHRRAGRLCMQFNSLVTGADIQPGSALGPGLLIPSPCGVTISTKAGDNLVVLSLVGLGGSVRDKDIGAGLGLPVVGSSVMIGQFAGVHGSIRLGDRVVMEAGAGAVVPLSDGARMVPAVEPRIGDPPTVCRRASPPAVPCGHARWRRTHADWRADVMRYAEEASRYGPPTGGTAGRLSAILTNSLLAILVYRTSHWLYLNGRRRLAMLLCQANILFHKLTIPPASCIGGGLLMPHLASTVFCGRAGANVTLYANSLCTTEANALAAPIADSPIMGDDIMVGGHSGVFGPVIVGNRVALGPKVQLGEDVASDTQLWSPMSRGSERLGGVGDANSANRGALPESSAAPSMHRLPPDSPWRETRRRMKQDRTRLFGSGTAPDREPQAAVPAFPALTCVRWFRLSHYFSVIGWRRMARWCWLVNAYLTGADISPCCEIGGGLMIPHPAGVALHCRAGASLTVMAASGVAASLDSEDRVRSLDRAPQLGDEVYLSHHSGIYGPVTIGDRVRLLPGCILLRSVPGGVALIPRPLKFRKAPRLPGRKLP